MNPAPLRAVVDASVAVKIFVPEALSTQAQEIFARFATESGAELIVPDFFFAECANVFWKWAQRSSYPPKHAQEHLRDLIDLGLTVMPDRIVAEDALGIALKHRITAYDACYVAAATQLQLPLITADEKLAMKMAKSAFEVLWLGDTQVAPK
ncbi:MAG: type II toxin-antitoxin system VapC family toxin [Gammaproteobacteria bacterium]|nr:type II toxin-antitoxin system VapC family toxin [Gammaproteobacteria bacterium]